MARTAEFTALLVPAPVLMMVGLLVSTLQALRHGEASALWRVYFGVAPACVAGIALARPIALLILDAVNQLSSNAASTVAAHETVLGTALTGLTPTTPGFGVFLLACVVVVGTMLLWFELIVRTVVLTLLLVLVPVVVPLATFPSMRRLGWRLGETFVAVAVSKFAIVVTLVLGLNEADRLLGNGGHHGSSHVAAGNSNPVPGPSGGAVSRAVSGPPVRRSSFSSHTSRREHDLGGRPSRERLDAGRARPLTAVAAGGSRSRNVARVGRVAHAAPHPRHSRAPSTDRQTASSRRSRRLRP